MENNPYQSPAPTPGMPAAPAANKRPTVATVFGILNLIFGVFGLCGVVAGGAMMFVPANANPNAPNPVLQIMEDNAVYRMFNQVSLVLGFIAVVALIISGVGLLQMKPYGRKLAIGYGLYAIISALIGLLLNMVFVVPTLMEKINTLPDGPEKAGAYGGMIGGVVGGCVGMIFPLVLLIFMFRPEMKAAFASSHAVPAKS